MCVYFNLCVVNYFQRSCPYRRWSYRNTKGQAPLPGPHPPQQECRYGLLYPQWVQHTLDLNQLLGNKLHYKAEIAVLSEKSTLTRSFQLVILLVSGVLKFKCLCMSERVYFLWSESVIYSLEVEFLLKLGGKLLFGLQVSPRAT